MDEPVYGFATLYEAVVLPGIAAGVPERLMEVPAHPLAAIAVGAVGGVEMVKLAPLSLPVTTGFELTTRILYPLPPVVPAGIVHEIVPALVDVNVPILIGLAKEPAAFES